MHGSWKCLSNYTYAHHEVTQTYMPAVNAVEMTKRTRLIKLKYIQWVHAY